MKFLISNQQKIFKVRQKPGDKDHIQGTDLRGKNRWAMRLAKVRFFVKIAKRIKLVPRKFLQLDKES